MKMTKLLLTGIAAAIAFATPIMAKGDKDGNAEKKEKAEKKADKPDKADREARKAKKKEMLERFDTDKDGKLSKEERKIGNKTLKKEAKKKDAEARKKGKKDGEAKKKGKKKGEKKGK